jgi:hypothetical protein
MKNKSFNIILTVLAVTLFLVIGCTGPTRVEMDHGTSFNLAKFNQIANPDAQNNMNPVTGLDGQAADRVMTRYLTDFEKPSLPPVYKLSFGGNSGQ